jgi:hypothetical protein
MKKLIILAAVLVTSASLHAQGTVNFSNLLPPSINAPVFDVGGTTGLGNTFRAQLYAGPAGAAETALTAQGTAASFLSQGFFSAGTVQVTGVAGGAQAALQVRAWDGAFATYEAAVAANGKFGKSSVLTLALGGAGSPPSTPANLTGLSSFTLTQVPEPGTLALGVLGAAALFLRRRK